jgi:Protein of unknown function (DUF3421)
MSQVTNQFYVYIDYKYVTELKNQGNDKYGQALYLARTALSDGSIVIGRAYEFSQAIFAYNSSVITALQFEVLEGAAPGYSIRKVPWIGEETVPVGAVIVGRTKQREILFAGSICIKDEPMSVHNIGSVQKGMLTVVTTDRRSIRTFPANVFVVKQKIPIQLDTASPFVWKMHSAGEEFRAGEVDAFAVGKHTDGSALYIARALFPDGSVVIGKVGPSLAFSSGARFPWRGQDVTMVDYEILCGAPPGSYLLAVPWFANYPPPPGVVVAGMYVTIHGDRV